MAKTYVVFIEVKSKKEADKLIDEIMTYSISFQSAKDYEIVEYPTDDYIDKFIR